MAIAMGTGRRLAIVCGLWLLLATLCNECQAMDEAEGKEMLKGMAADCKEKEGASDEDVDDMVNKKMPTTGPGKCLNACMMDQFGVIADNSLSKDGLKEVTRMATENNEEMVNMAEKIADDCKDTADPDRCELAVKIMQCMQTSAEKHGMKQ